MYTSDDMHHFFLSFGCKDFHHFFLALDFVFICGHLALKKKKHYDPFLWIGLTFKDCFVAGACSKLTTETLEQGVKYVQS